MKPRFYYLILALVILLPGLASAAVLDQIGGEEVDGEASAGELGKLGLEINVATIERDGVLLDQA